MTVCSYKFNYQKFNYWPYEIPPVYDPPVLNVTTLQLFLSFLRIYHDKCRQYAYDIYSIVCRTFMIKEQMFFAFVLETWFVLGRLNVWLKASNRNTWKKKLEVKYNFLRVNYVWLFVCFSFEFVPLSLSALEVTLFGLAKYCMWLSLAAFSLFEFLPVLCVFPSISFI